MKCPLQKPLDHFRSRMDHLVAMDHRLGITDLKDEQLVVTYSSVIQPLLFSTFPEYLLFGLLRICDAIPIQEIVALKIKVNARLNDYIMRLL